MSVSPDASPMPEPAPVQDFDVHSFWDEHKSKVLIGIVAAVAIFAIYLISDISAKHKATAATNALAAAKSIEELRKVVSDFSGTPAAGNALLVIGERLRGEQKYEESVAALKEFTTKYAEHPLIAGGMLSLGATYQAQGKNTEAVETYQQITARHPKSYAAPMGLLAQATIAEASQKPEEARRILESIIAQYADSVMRYEAQARLRALPRPANAPANPSTANPLGGFQLPNSGADAGTQQAVTPAQSGTVSGS